MSGKRRNPWRARKTVGWVPVDADGNEVSTDSPDAVTTKQKFVTIGYYHTRAEAMTALATYNGEPTQTPTKAPTFADVYEKFAETRKDLSYSARSRERTLFKYLLPLQAMPLTAFTTTALDDFLAAAEYTPAVKQRMSIMIRQVFTYAQKKGYLEKNVAENIDTYSKKSAPALERHVFTPEELETLRKTDHPYARAVIIGCYMGWRPSELIGIRKSDIDLSDMTIKGGSKTEAGKDRIVPIHPDIWPLVERQLAYSTSDKLFPGTYATYSRYYITDLRPLTGVQHTPHDTRHTFATYAKQCRLDPMIIKRLIGHKINDVTEGVYTHVTVEQLRTEIEKLCIVCVL